MIHINFVADNAILQLLQDIGKAYSALASFDCKKAVALFETLPPHQLNTCWVLQQIGTAYFEMTDYHRVCSVITIILLFILCTFSIVLINKEPLKATFSGLDQYLVDSIFHVFRFVGGHFFHKEFVLHSVASGGFPNGAFVAACFWT